MHKIDIHGVNVVFKKIPDGVLPKHDYGKSIHIPEFNINSIAPDTATGKKECQAQLEANVRYLLSKSKNAKVVTIGFRGDDFNSIDREAEGNDYIDKFVYGTFSISALNPDGSIIFLTGPYHFSLQLAENV